MAREPLVLFVADYRRVPDLRYAQPGILIQEYDFGGDENKVGKRGLLLVGRKGREAQRVYDRFHEA